MRPWFDGEKDGKTLKVGDRIDIRWNDGLASAHNFTLQAGKPGFTLVHRETPIWVPLKGFQFRKIPTQKRISPPPPSNSKPLRRVNNFGNF